MKLVECVPNFSEGKDQSILDAIAASINTVKGVTLLDVDPGESTNRTVFTMVGSPDLVVDAAFEAIKKAAELIDMSKHTGAHPRFGATDVCPFIPVSDMTMDECVELARKLGKRVGEELQIPVYLYEYAASKPEWQNLAEVRKGEYEGLAGRAGKPEWQPDFGPHTFNAKSGALAIGAREFLIAYNINLNSRDKKKAHDLALTIREKGRFAKNEKGKFIKDKDGNKLREEGLFANCKAVGWYVDDFQRAQISINLTNYKITPPHIVLEKVRELAVEKGIQITGSEIVGLLPKEAMLEAGKYYLNRLGECAGQPEKMILTTAVQSMGLDDLYKFQLDKKVIEYAIKVDDKLAELTLVEFTDELSTNSPAPGGGSVAALCLSISGALSSMVANLTFDKKGYEVHWEAVKPIAERGQKIKAKAMAAIDEDTEAFNEMMAAMKLPKKTDEEKALREDAMQEATKKAIMVPFQTLELAVKAVELAAEIAAIGNSNALSDAGVAAITATAAAQSAFLNVKINMAGITDDNFKQEIMSKSEIILAKIKKKANIIFEDIKSRL
ncbi:MAG: glutamate formimidoyltransferase [Candidatus Stygibacter australis]|nr:glutamate formimidoyltransferase [Candidatus Stygibacter australis]